LSGSGNELLLIGQEPGSIHQAIDFVGNSITRLQIGLQGVKGSPIHPTVNLNDEHSNSRLEMFLGDDGNPVIGLGLSGADKQIVLGLRSDGSVINMGNVSIVSSNSGATLSLGSGTARDSLLLNVEANGRSWVKADSFRGGN
jgi:hypothetical protein